MRSELNLVCCIWTAEITKYVEVCVFATGCCRDSGVEVCDGLGWWQGDGMPSNLFAFPTSTKYHEFDFSEENTE